MGGKALNKYGVFTERKNTEEFNRIGYELGNHVFSDFTYVTSVVKCYHTKADHGDLDLLIKIPVGVDINWSNYIRDSFKPQAINANGGVYSFDYKGFQVDFIPIPENKWNTALVYFSYDPLGNIMGKTYHKFGLSYGWEGLHYKFRGFSGTVVDDILISTDIEKIFEFGGYNYERYTQGFDTLEEIFNFCIAGKYFDTHMFQMDSLNHIDRKRNRKRGSYHLFLNYLQNNNINTRYDFLKNKEDYVKTIDTYFPNAHLLDELEALKQEDSRRKIISQKFNGDMVMAWLPDLQGNELGAAIRKFKNELGDEFNSFVLNSDFQTIKSRFLLVYHG